MKNFISFPMKSRDFLFFEGRCVTCPKLTSFTERSQGSSTNDFLFFLTSKIHVQIQHKRQ